MQELNFDSDQHGCQLRLPRPVARIGESVSVVTAGQDVIIQNTAGLPCEPPKGVAMHQRILVPVDGSHTSTLGLQEAIRIAMDQRARLRLIKLGATRAEFEEALAMAVLYGWRSVTDVCGGGIGCIRGDVGRLMHFFLCCYGTDIQVRSFLQESDMHTVIWTIDVNEGTSRQDIQQGITASASDYRGVAGLIRTCFGIAADGRSIIEIYLWESKSAAEAFFTREWETEVSRRWQAAPMRRQDWDTPVVVDGG